MLAYRLDCALSFSAPVEGHVFGLRCSPRAAGARGSVRCDPPAPLFPWADAFGNTVLAGRIDAPHAHFSFVSEGTVPMGAAPDRTPPQPFLRYPTRLTAPGPALRALLLRAPRGETEAATARALSRLVHGALEYAPGRTGVRTRAEEALSFGEGVCQDYSHVLIALLRMRGICCRYACGLIPGEGKTHAWVEFWDGAAWEGLDPTNGALAGPAYIKIAHGCDFSDCPVESGIFYGTARQSMTVTATLQDIPSP